MESLFYAVNPRGKKEPLPWAKDDEGLAKGLQMWSLLNAQQGVPTKETHFSEVYRKEGDLLVAVLDSKVGERYGSWRFVIPSGAIELLEPLWE